VLHLLSTRPPNERYLDRLVLKSAGATHLLRVTEIDWIEGAGVYVNLHVAGKELLYRAALNQLETRLDPARFIRVHRSAIVNIDSIVRLESASHGEFDVILKHGGQTRVSRTYRSALEQRLGQSL
jgi:two-component system LytT family response regulator